MKLQLNRRMALWVLVALGLELIAIYVVSQWIGGLTTILLLILMGLAGAFLAVAEGRKVWAEAQRQLQQGQIPGQSAIDGICVAVGGLMLMVPGFLSDIVGITLLLPFTRRYYRMLVLSWIEKLMRNGSFRIGRF